MQFESTSSLVQVLAHWGEHEGRGRLQSQVQERRREAALDWVDLLLHARPRMVAHLLNRRPSLCVMVQLDPEDAGRLTLPNGGTIEEWLRSLRDTAANDSLHHIDRLAREDPSPHDRVVVAARLLEERQTYSRLPLGPCSLYDGWHRVAAWRRRCESGQPSRLGAYLVATEH